MSDSESSCSSFEILKSSQESVFYTPDFTEENKLVDFDETDDEKVVTEIENAELGKF